jgi:hypothetical protein
VIPSKLAESEFGVPGTSEGTFHFHCGGQALQVFAMWDFDGASGWVAGVTIWMSNNAKPRRRGIYFCFSIIFFNWPA